MLSFSQFIIISIPEYLDQLKNEVCTLLASIYTWICLPPPPTHTKIKSLLLKLPTATYALVHLQLWGGELELVVLSRLYERSIIIYNEANGIVHEQVFQASEDQAGSQQHNPVSLFSPLPSLKISCKLAAFLSPRVYWPTLII